MFFENEKDIARDGADIQVSDDGTITWDDVLDVSDDETPNKEKADMSDEINLSADNTGEITDDELAGMLNDADNLDDNTDDIDSSNFDLDKQLENVDVDVKANAKSNFKIPEKKQKKSGLMPVLIAILFGVIVAGGAYYVITYLNEQNVSGDGLERNQTVEDAMNNTTSEDIAQRQEEKQEEGIPVVNEDEASEIKPDEQEETPKEEEKKEVITVIPTGRPNPFVPIAKYLKIEIPEINTVVQYNKAKIAQPPLEFAKEDPATKKMTTIAVSGIMYDEQKPSAIITFENNDYFVQKGDKLDDYRVIDIAKNSVTIAYGKNIYKANIGEEFKLTEFYGNAKYLNGNSAGGRQYYSIKDSGTEDESKKKLKGRYSEFAEAAYVSDSDVTIRTK